MSATNPYDVFHRPKKFLHVARRPKFLVGTAGYRNLSVTKFFAGPVAQGRRADGVDRRLVAIGHRAVVCSGAERIGNRAKTFVAISPHLDTDRSSSAPGAFRGRSPASRTGSQAGRRRA